jgi:tetrahydromethanopterin S-methyltransferase subunit G
LVSRDKRGPVVQVDRDLDVKQIARRLDMLDERLDNMDTVITSLVERVMGRPLIVEIPCPKCGQIIQVNVTSSVRLRGKE